MFKDKSKYDLKNASFTLEFRQIIKAGHISTPTTQPTTASVEYIQLSDATTAQKSNLTLTTPTQVLSGDQNHVSSINLFYQRPQASHDNLKIKIFYKTLGVITLIDSNKTQISPDPATGLFTLLNPGTYTLTIPNVSTGNTLAISGNDTSPGKLPIDEIDLPMQ